MGKGSNGGDFRDFCCILCVAAATIGTICGAVWLAKQYADSHAPASDVISNNTNNTNKSLLLGFLGDNDTNTTAPTSLTGQPTPLTGLTGSVTYFIFGCGVLMGLAVLGVALHRNRDYFKSRCLNLFRRNFNGDEELRQLSSVSVN